MVWDVSAFTSTFIAFNKFSMVLDTEAVPMLDGNNIVNIAAMLSRRLLLVSNCDGNNLPMAIDIIWLICSVELAPNKIGNIEAIVWVIGWVLSSGNSGISAARA